MKHELKHILEPIFMFLIELVLGSVIFMLIVIPAVGLNYFIHFLQSKDIVDSVIITGLTWVEYVMFAVDACLFIFFVIKSAIKTGKAL